MANFARKSYFACPDRRARKLAPNQYFLRTILNFRDKINQFNNNVWF